MKAIYQAEPDSREKFIHENDRFYTRFAGIYDALVKTLPTWKRWICQVLPYIEGPRVLEVSFGTGYLLTQYAHQFETFGIDFNQRMVITAQQNLKRAGIEAELKQGSVEDLPYPNECFDTVVNTMAFTAYPNGRQAMTELYRVLKPGGKLVMVDINYPQDGNRLGTIGAKMWQALGDVLRDMGALFQEFGFEYTNQEIGGFGSIHLYVAKKA